MCVYVCVCMCVCVTVCVSSYTAAWTHRTYIHICVWITHIFTYTYICHTCFIVHAIHICVIVYIFLHTYITNTHTLSPLHTHKNTYKLYLCMHICICIFICYTYSNTRAARWFQVGLPTKTLSIKYLDPVNNCAFIFNQIKQKSRRIPCEIHFSSYICHPYEKRTKSYDFLSVINILL